MALAEKQTTSAVIMIGVALVTVVGIAFGLYKARGVEVDGDALLRERFAYDELPFALEVKEAHQTAVGDRLIRLGPLVDIGEQSNGEGSGEDASEAPSKIVAPERVIVIFYEKALGAKLNFPSQPSGIAPDKWMEWSAAKALAEGEETDGGKALKKKAFRGEVTRGHVEFGTWTSLYIQERLFRATGKWVDSMRVNLSGDGHNLVLFAEYPPEVDGSEAALAALLEGLKLRAPGS
jgi:hypothetical protein